MSGLFRVYRDMKRLLFSLILSLSLLASGCRTNIGTTEINDSRVRQVALVAELAAFNGAKVYLIDHPEKRVVFEKVSNDLGVLLATDTVFLDKFLTIVRTLPIKELNSEKGQLIVDNAVILFGALKSDVIKLDQLEQAQKLEPIAVGLKSGIDKALR